MRITKIEAKELGIAEEPIKPKKPRLMSTDPLYNKNLLYELFLKQAAHCKFVVPGHIREVQFAKELKRRHRFDICFMEQRVAVETDGVVHTRFNRWTNDIEKSQLASALGWRVLHVNKKMLKDNPQYFFDLLRMALEWKVG